MKSKLLILLMAFMAFAASAQKAEKIWERTDARILEPEMKVYIRPQIADFQILENQHRCYYGPYKFFVKDWEKMLEVELTNLKSEALYRAQKEADADVIVGAMFNTYISSTDDKTLVIELSGFPAKFVNFRNLGEEGTSDYEMVRIIYPTIYGKESDTLND